MSVLNNFFNQMMRNGAEDMGNEEDDQHGNDAGEAGGGKFGNSNAKDCQGKEADSVTGDVSLDLNKNDIREELTGLFLQEDCPDAQSVLNRQDITGWMKKRGGNTKLMFVGWRGRNFSDELEAAQNSDEDWEALFKL